ncbi:hypothetical protein SLEP1_g3196 [Rubroshorea leprosula]|uniref:Uncharacterized protein n=1 Tax=Rubroshorea leprosula TaxID=152421 RepID=A0AAV5HRZ4_9ROSI|nr:hypothetical protein SLEP1_g3196 [Rubroshorea leprosula]
MSTPAKYLNILLSSSLLILLLSSSYCFFLSLLPSSSSLKPRSGFFSNLDLAFQQPRSPCPSWTCSWHCYSPVFEVKKLGL